MFACKDTQAIEYVNKYATFFKKNTKFTDKKLENYVDKEISKIMFLNDSKHNKEILKSALRYF